MKRLAFFRGTGDGHSRGRGLIGPRGYCAFFVMLFLMIAPALKSELASTSEMEQVCQNWLSQMIFQKGTWAGSFDPKIAETMEISSGDTVLARCYNISPKGFVVVPVLKEMPPIRAYSEDQWLDKNQPDGILLLLRDVLSNQLSVYGKRFGSLEASQPASGEAVFGRSHRLLWNRFEMKSTEFQADLTSGKYAPLSEGGPLLVSSWTQRKPYNLLCPYGDGGRCVVGCVATATAQILKYWQWPPHGLGTYSYYWAGDNSCGGSTAGQTLDADYSDPYDWGHMPDSCDNGCSLEDSTALAELCYEVGVAFDMQYGACGSGASTLQAANVFPTYFIYKPSPIVKYRDQQTQPEWFAFITAEIDSLRPIQYRILNHSIVCDGWRDQGFQYEYHMNYGWGGNSTAWYILDSLYCYWVMPDSVCPAMEEFMITHIEPQTDPLIEFCGNEVSEGSGGDGDGLLEPGETGTLLATARNLGWDASSVIGVLSCLDSYVTVTTPLVDWGGMLSGEEKVSPSSFELSVSPGCPNPFMARMVLQLTSVPVKIVVDTFYICIGGKTGFSDNMQNGDGQWTHHPGSPVYSDEWHLDSYRYHTAAPSWKVGGQDSLPYGPNLDAMLLTQPFVLPPNARLTFWHRMDAEIEDSLNAYDGGFVMIKTSACNWDELIPQGGYPYTMYGYLRDLPTMIPCYSGNKAWSRAVFDLSGYSGEVQLMFRFYSDFYVNFEGWNIDDIVVKAGGLTGDANDDGNINVSDAVFIINYVFAGGNAPNPYGLGDSNCDAVVNVSDAVFIINYVFIGGSPVPGDPNRDGIPDC